MNSQDYNQQTNKKNIINKYAVHLSYQNFIDARKSCLKCVCVVIDCRRNTVNKCPSFQPPNILCNVNFLGLILNILILSKKKTWLN